MKFPRLKLIFFSLVFISNCLNAQFADKNVYLIDSLVVSNLTKEDSTIIAKSMNAYSKAKSDTAKLKIIENLIEGCSEDKIWLQYNRILLSQAIKKSEQQGISLAEKKFFESEIGMAYNNAGFYYLQTGDYEQALTLYKTSLEFRKKAGDRTGIGACYNNLGNIYKIQGNIPLAIEYYNYSLKIQEEIGDKKGESYSLNNLGGIYTNLGDTKTALIYYQKSLKIRQEVADHSGIATTLTNLGNILLREGKKDTALSYYNRALEIRKKINDKRAVASSLNAIGEVYKTNGDYKEAMRYFNESLELEKQNSDNPHMGETIFRISSVYLAIGDNKKAIQVIEENSRLFKSLNSAIQYNNIYSVLYKAYANEKNWAKAYESFKLFISLRDSLSNKELNNLATKQRYQHEYDKKAIADSIKTSAQKQQDSIVHEQQLSKQRTYTYGGLIGLALMIIVAVISFRAYRIKQRSNSALTEKNTLIEEQKKEVEHQKHLVEEKQKETLDSIHYANRIQKALLANSEILKTNLADNFVLFKPKDIVSGDFYWAAEHSNKFYLAVCDSTGHGVPGAFMCLLNIGFMSEAINEKNISEPNEVFNYVRQRLINSISKEGQKDGFDGILLCIDKITKKITYSAANNSPLLVSKSGVIHLPCDKMPVGKGEREDSFKLFEIEAKKDQLLYLYTDGYADQFGGSKGKKFKYKQLEELLLSVHALPTNEQLNILHKTFEDWRGALEQVDDVCVIGVII